METNKRYNEMNHQGAECKIICNPMGVISKKGWPDL